MSQTHFTFNVFISVFNHIPFLEYLDFLIQPFLNTTPMNPFETSFTSFTTSNHWILWIQLFFITYSTHFLFWDCLLFILGIVLLYLWIGLEITVLYDFLLLVSDLPYFQIDWTQPNDIIFIQIEVFIMWWDHIPSVEWVF